MTDLRQHAPPLLRMIDAVRAATHDGTPLAIVGGGSKPFYGGAAIGTPLEVRDLAGIAAYEPSELVITASAGTPVADVEDALAAKGQCLPFEPPRFAAGGTIGGMVAAGLSGPARAQLGALRDYVLGTTVLTGRAELLTFGGQVMKNVAGYDVSRLMAGSMGSLGVICEVSLKVVPVPAARFTLQFEMTQNEALTWFGLCRRLPLPLTATGWFGGRLRIRLAGARAAVGAAATKLGGIAVDDDAADAYWRDLRDQRDGFFAIDPANRAGDERLWRLSVPATAPALPLQGEPLIEWAGAQRWYRTTAPADAVRAVATRAGGHATLFRGSDASGPFTPLAEPQRRIHRRLKAAFDPAGILNPGRLDVHC